MPFVFRFRVDILLPYDLEVQGDPKWVLGVLFMDGVKVEVQEAQVE
jgi:hypothetical protein